MRRSGAVDPRPLARMAKRHLRSLRFGLWKTKPEPLRAPVRHLSRAHRPERQDRSENDIGGRLRYQSWQQNNRPVRYLSSTPAPASSSFFLMDSASSLPMFSFTGLGAPSTRSFASLRPRPVISRTVLMTLIFEAPASLRTTVNSDFSSVAAAAPPAPPPAGAAATATGAAETPQRSWRNLPNFAISRIDQASISLASLSNFGFSFVSGVAVAVAM